jgi:thiol-disulfide isomerase/thioredoxin
VLLTLLISAVGWRLQALAGVGAPAPEISGQAWINTDPLRLADLKGKVVLVEFWTFGCFNCRNIEPHVKEWHQKYADKGLVVIGVHTPETDFERYVKNVQHYVHEEQIPYAVVTDNDFTTWTRYGNRAWPVIYLIDKQGVIRYSHVGEGSYVQTEQQIQMLLAER